MNGRRMVPIHARDVRALPGSLDSGECLKRTLMFAVLVFFETADVLVLAGVAKGDDVFWLVGERVSHGFRVSWVIVNEHDMVELANVV